MKRPETHDEFIQRHGCTADSPLLQPWEHAPFFLCPDGGRVRRGDGCRMEASENEKERRRDILDYRQALLRITQDEYAALRGYILAQTGLDHRLWAGDFPGVDRPALDRGRRLEGEDRAVRKEIDAADAANEAIVSVTT